MLRTRRSRTTVSSDPGAAMVTPDAIPTPALAVRFYRSSRLNVRRRSRLARACGSRALRRRAIHPGRACRLSMSRDRAASTGGQRMGHGDRRRGARRSGPPAHDGHVDDESPRRTVSASSAGKVTPVGWSRCDGGRGAKHRVQGGATISHVNMLLSAMDETAQWEERKQLRAGTRASSALGQRLLDVGCGQGDAALALVDRPRRPNRRGRRHRCRQAMLAEALEADRHDGAASVSSWATPAPSTSPTPASTRCAASACFSGSRGPARAVAEMARASPAGWPRVPHRLGLVDALIHAGDPDIACARDLRG